MYRKRALLTLLLGLALTTLGCGGGGVSNPPVQTKGQYGSLEFTLTTPRTLYRRGEKVPLTFRIRNTSAQTVATRILGADIRSRATRGDQAFDINGVIITDGFGPLLFAPGASETYTKEWGQMASGPNGHVITLEPGTYQIRQWLNAVSVDGVDLSPEEAQNLLSAPPIEITIE